jgi:hypothetical protein
MYRRNQRFATPSQETSIHTRAPISFDFFALHLFACSARRGAYATISINANRHLFASKAAIVLIFLVIVNTHEYRWEQ